MATQEVAGTRLRSALLVVLGVVCRYFVGVSRKKMFNLMRSQPLRLASAAARTFSTSAEVCSTFCRAIRRHVPRFMWCRSRSVFLRLAQNGLDVFSMDYAANNAEKRIESVDA